MFWLWMICGDSVCERLNLRILRFVKFILLRNEIKVDGGNVIEFYVSFKVFSCGNLWWIICKCWGVIKFFCRVFGCCNSCGGIDFVGFEWRYCVKFNFFNVFVYCKCFKNIVFYFKSGIFK